MPVPLRVLHFVDSFHVGGAERQFVHFVRGLEEGELDVRIACLRDEGGLREDLPAWLPAPVEVRLGSLKSLRALRQLLALRRRLRAERVDVVHSTSLYPNVFAMTAAALARTPVRIASVRDMGTMWTDGQRRMQRLACRAAHAVVVNAEAVAERLRREGYAPERLVVIRNGIDLSRWEARAPAGDLLLRQELGVPVDAPLVGSICRLHRVKRLEDLVDAAARVLTRHPAARFLVVGPTDGYPDRERYARELSARARLAGVGDRFRFVGGRSDVARVLSELSVSVLCSESEGLSNTLLESMAVGLPVVATRVGGNPEVVVDEETGYLVPVKDPGSLAEAISRLLAEPQRAAEMGRAGRRRVERHFARRRMVSETRALYQRLVARTGRDAALRVPVASGRSVLP